MSYDDKLDLIISRLGAIEAKLSPAPTGGLYDLVRPAVRDVSPWSGVEMRGPDPFAALARALHGVDWRGYHLDDTGYDEAWEEIEQLKRGIGIEFYRALDPEFAGYALLVGLISPAKYDGATWGTNRDKRLALAGATVESFISDQFAVSGSASGQ